LNNLHYLNIINTSRCEIYLTIKHLTEIIVLYLFENYLSSYIGDSLIKPI
jgi:hypothetical protein